MGLEAENEFARLKVEHAAIRHGTTDAPDVEEKVGVHYVEDSEHSSVQNVLLGCLVASDVSIGVSIFLPALAEEHLGLV